MKIRISGHLNKNDQIEQNKQSFYEEKFCLMNKVFAWLNKNMDGDDQGHSNNLDLQKTFD